MTWNLLVLLQLLAVPVGSVPLSEVAFAPTHDAPARVVARNESRLSAEISAVVQELLVDVGDRVSLGARLVELDCRSFRLDSRRASAELAALEAQTDLARRRLERARRLRETETVSEELLDQREGEWATLSAQVLGARAAVEDAGLQVKRCTMQAPFHGVVTARSAQLGELTQPGTPLLTLVELGDSYVAAQVTLEQAGQLEVAQDLRFVWSEGEVPLKLVHLLPVVKRETRTREARLDPAAAGALPGTAGRLFWTAPGLALPAELLVRREGNLGVFVLEESGGGLRARFHAIPGAEEGRPVRMELPGTTRLVTEGRLSLRDGDEVTLR